MGRKKAHTPEEIVAKLRQTEVLIGQARRWPTRCGRLGDGADLLSLASGIRGLKLDQVKRLKELERENARLRKAVSDLTLEKVILKEAASGKW